MIDNYCNVDCYLDCVDGFCPLEIEYERYGVNYSTCDNFCGPFVPGCDTCYFLGDVMCDDCIYKHYDDSKLENGGR